MFVYGKVGGSFWVIRINAQGLHPVAEKVGAVQEAQEPRNTSDFEVILAPPDILFLILAKIWQLC